MGDKNGPSGLLLSACAHQSGQNRLKGRHGLHAHPATGTSFIFCANHLKVAN
ncbi:hypothetical protein EHW99_1616 [Erwinia amylovora]|uniref:Lipoprotein n=2 Tax=Erwinia amylovora TaxID=552 RepID=A0A831EQX1_ERWAM|nr:hypothetical protein EaACW_1980 [Erwinia amylovora ACW56400]QJQ54320.1 hypothetical protein EHX00_1616 [Erwinia amylovora]CBA20919.1 hypothetical protein predicted by Glimmer/Critica [Erwinia amylovora CFBP1430]CCO78827.1 hypothetical protein BN432_2030 [Erwinia amylovora Ea356]CCO82625.1 hypothetical protein BN433_2055 [Erwinia amylovora Ea266]CCO86406.1 hypothetical protein BN434_2019 [Erwinia amylovora CFBP 2585]CCO90192.1 hypothetical protein BN435_2022 [Erwinia amylovora 01SFR-BO]CCO